MLPAGGPSIQCTRQQSGSCCRQEDQASSAPDNKVAHVAGRRTKHPVHQPTKWLMLPAGGPSIQCTRQQSGSCCRQEDQASSAPDNKVAHVAGRRTKHPVHQTTKWLMLPAGGPSIQCTRQQSGFFERNKDCDKEIPRIHYI